MCCCKREHTAVAPGIRQNLNKCERYFSSQDYLMSQKGLPKQSNKNYFSIFHNSINETKRWKQKEVQLKQILVPRFDMFLFLCLKITMKAIKWSENSSASRGFYCPTHFASPCTTSQQQCTPKSEKTLLTPLYFGELLLGLFSETIVCNIYKFQSRSSYV